MRTAVLPCSGVGLLFLVALVLLAPECSDRGVPPPANFGQDCFTITSPVVGTGWVLGTEVSITWNHQEAGDRVDIELHEDRGLVCLLVDDTENDGEFTWTVDACGAGPAANFRIRISDSVDDVCASLSQRFSILPEMPTVSFATDVQSLFSPNCMTVNGCHSNNGHKGDLVLALGASYGNLVGVVSDGYAPSLRVVPGDRDASVLFQKLLGNPAFGDQMPLEGSISAEEIETIGIWIDEGALNN